MTTAESNVRRQLNAALLAIMQHAVDHELPTPRSIAADESGVTLWLEHTNVRIWLATLQHRGTEIWHFATETMHGQRVDHQVQLPDTGVVFQLHTGIALPVDLPIDDDGHTEDWHQPCAGSGCTSLVCLQTPHDPTHGAEPCEHGFCPIHRRECSECASLARADVRF